jgi:predicted Zn-dependent protease
VALALALPAWLAGTPAALAGDPFTPFISEADEARIGAEQHEKILAEFGGAYDNPALVRYVDSIGQFLALTSERPNVRFTFTVLNSPIVNAFAVPGGYVYVSRGLLALAGDEAELAGVLAHEIGHVSARHGAQRISTGILAQLGLGLLGLLTDSQELAGIAQFGALAVLQSYSREQEYEADLRGVRYLSRAGFDPEAMASFLSKLRAHSELEAAIAGQTGGGDRFDIFATHPRTAERVRRAIHAAGVRRVADPIVARDIYLGKIDGILYGDDPEQGVVRGRSFVHPVLGFRFEAPPDFQMLNGMTQVLARGPDGTAFVFDLDQRRDRRPMTRYIRDVWAPKAQLQQLEPIMVNGLEAATAALRTEVEGQTYDARLVAIAFDGRSIYRFTFLTPPRLRRRYDEAFRRTTYSFRTIAAAEAAAVRPRRLVLHHVRRGETSAAIARRTPFEKYALQRFLVLNGLYPDEPLAAGRTVKVVTE